MDDKAPDELPGGSAAETKYHEAKPATPPPRELDASSQQVVGELPGG